jgi:CRP/FNR family transcriptional regulator, cyclic AMP receptor protein
MSSMPASKVQSDVQILRRLKDLSWLSHLQLKRLDDSMTARNVKRKGVIFQERGLLNLNTHILLSGTAELCHSYGPRSRVIAILSPGIIFRMPLMARAVDHNFKWTALNDCRVAELSTDRYIKITLGILGATYLRVANAEGARWGSLLGRYPGFLGFDLQARVAVALLELAFEFGVQNTRGILIRITLSHRQLADLVGATRPRVGEVLADLERREIVVREGRQLAVLVSSLEALIRRAAGIDD